MSKFQIYRHNAQNDGFCRVGFPCPTVKIHKIYVGLNDLCGRAWKPDPTDCAYFHFCSFVAKYIKYRITAGKTNYGKNKFSFDMSAALPTSERYRRSLQNAPRRHTFSRRRQPKKRRYPPLRACVKTTRRFLFLLLRQSCCQW